MKKIVMLFISSLLFWCSSSFASPLINQWADGDQFYCEYGDGQVISIYANQNCPLYN